MKISMLPRFVVLKSKLNNKYLQLVRDQSEEVESLRFTAEEVASPLAKFEVVMAKKDRLRFVHLKCCSNSKYCVASDGIIVSANADEPEEDQSKPSCTLFEPIAANIDDLNTFRFKIVSHGKYAALTKEQERLGLSADGGDLSDAFTAIDWWKEAQPPTVDLESRALNWLKMSRPPTTLIDDDESSKLESDPSAEIRATVTSRTIDINEYHIFAGFLLPPEGEDLFVSAGEATNVSNMSVEATFDDPVFPFIQMTRWQQSDPRQESLAFGMRMTFNLTGIPRINSESTLDLLPIQETIHNYRWGNFRFSMEESKVSYTVMVPPRTRVRVNFLSSLLACEVPFSYTRRDTLSNGTRPQYIMHDGTCTHHENNAATFEVLFEKL